MPTINIKLAEIALERVSGDDFERFFQAFFPSIVGIDFVPMGGMRDGGADAFEAEGLFSKDPKRPTVFYQASTSIDHRQKITNTVTRIREVGRDLTALQYVSSRPIARLDMEEEHLSSKLAVQIRIRDQRWIIVHINDSEQTREAFWSYLWPCVSFLTTIGGASTISEHSNVPIPRVYVFLRQEVDRRRNHFDLINAVTDSLILWALEGTDPDKGMFLKRGEIKQKIASILPDVGHLIDTSFDHRIESMATEGPARYREVRWYRRTDKFCLSYTTRKIVEDENTEDEFLKISVMRKYEERARKELGCIEGISPKDIALVVHRSIELTFSKEGLSLVEFLTDANGNENQGFTIADQVDEALTSGDIPEDMRSMAKEVTLAVLRKAFYHSTESERIYYGKLCRTYTLLFTLRKDPKIVEYFRTMSSNFMLFVGSDIIIRALSERYLNPEDQMTVNMLKIIKQAGSELLVTQAVIEEVHAHLAASDNEFCEQFLSIEPYLTRDIVRHSSKILIRAYFYAKFDSSPDRTPTSWQSFISQFCTYGDLHNRPKSRMSIRYYLIERFDFKFCRV